jgi:hypothetical protein
MTKITNTPDPVRPSNAVGVQLTGPQNQRVALAAGPT